MGKNCLNFKGIHENSGKPYLPRGRSRDSDRYDARARNWGQ
jgi:hypothetical protein